MASMTMTASLLGGSAAGIFKQPPTTTRLAVIVAAKVSKVAEVEKAILLNANANIKEESNSMRRDLVFAAAVTTVCSIANVAMADEPKNGTAEAKKKYAPVCVTMSTARICRK